MNQLRIHAMELRMTLKKSEATVLEAMLRAETPRPNTLDGRKSKYSSSRTRINISWRKFKLSYELPRVSWLRLPGT